MFIICMVECYLKFFIIYNIVELKFYVSYFKWYVFGWVMICIIIGYGKVVRFLWLDCV